MLSAKLQAIGKNYSKWGSLIGESKSGVKVYEKVMGNRRVLGSFDKEGQLIKKVIIDKVDDATTTSVFKNDTLIRKTENCPNRFETIKYNNNGESVEHLVVNRAGTKYVSLDLGSGDKKVNMLCYPDTWRGKQFEVHGGKSALNNPYQGIEDISLHNDTYYIKDGVWESNGGKGDLGLAKALYDGFKKVFNLV